MAGVALFVDTHVHCDRCRQPELELAAARAKGTELFVVPGVTSGGWDELCRLARNHADIRIAPGLHPLAAREWNAALGARLEALLALPQAVAVGEIGLDADVAVADELQEQVFRAQLRLAIESQRPVLIHNRRRTGRILDILREEGAARIGGIIHAFSGSIESARQLIDLGFVIGVGGSFTWPEARRVRAMIAAAPDEALVLETDAPDLTPHPHCGLPNRPEYLPLIAAQLAALRGWSLDETARITTNNARRVLRLDRATHLLGEE